MGLTHHNGISVYGSGIYVGRASDVGGEAGPIINNSGYLSDGYLTHADTATGIKLAGGEVAFSGWANYRASTGLSTIKHFTAGIKRASTGAWDYTSGQATTVDWAYSGGVFDLFPRYQVQALSSVITSAGTSNVISWTALGT